MPECVHENLNMGAVIERHFVQLRWRTVTKTKDEDIFDLDL